MTNPFVYGEIVPSGAFIDRVDELDRIVADLRAAQKIFLISPRRYGKSSLIRQALRALGRRGVLTVEVTVSSFSSYLGFLEGYTRALLALDTPLGRSPVWLRDVIQTVKPEVRVEKGPRGGRAIAVAFPSARNARDLSRLAGEVFALPARIAADRRRPLAVALDEFQGIAAFDGEQVEQTLRSAVQDQRQVGYVFAGSEPSLMERMLGPKRPFYKAGPVMRLGKIAPDLFAEAIETRFAQSGIRSEAGLGEAVIELAGNLPYDVQRLAHEVWDDGRAAGQRRVGMDDLHTTLTRLLGEQDPFFEGLWQRLTLPQRAALRAVVLEEGHEMLSADTRTRYRLGGASTVQAALAALVRLDHVARDDGRYVVVDSLFREWVARKTH